MLCYHGPYQMIRITCQFGPVCYQMTVSELKMTFKFIA